MACSRCFSLGGNLDFLEFLKKSFITSTTGAFFVLLHNSWKYSFSFIQDFGINSRSDEHKVTKHSINVGSGYGTVDSTVGYDTREPGFEYSPQQLLLNNSVMLTVYGNDEKEERPRMTLKIIQCWVEQCIAFWHVL